MKSLSYLRIVMMGFALLIFVFGQADAGMTEKPMKKDDMKSKTMMEKPMKKDDMKSETMMEKPMKKDDMK
ncbi:MAG: hypothetical protein WAL93_04870 [Desulfobacterales bacterium]